MQSIWTSIWNYTKHHPHSDNLSFFFMLFFIAKRHMVLYDFEVMVHLICKAKTEMKPKSWVRDIQATRNKNRNKPSCWYMCVFCCRRPYTWWYILGFSALLSVSVPQAVNSELNLNLDRLHWPSLFIVTIYSTVHSVLNRGTTAIQYLLYLSLLLFCHNSHGFYSPSR